FVRLHAGCTLTQSAIAARRRGRGTGSACGPIPWEGRFGPDNLTAMQTVDVSGIKERIAEHAQLLERLRGEVRKVVVGQDQLVSRLLMSLLCGGHVLLEGVPGLAKTTVVKTLAQVLHVSFQRIQFTPDLLPADL